MSCVIPAAGGAARNLTADWRSTPARQPGPRRQDPLRRCRGARNVHRFAVAATGGAVRQVTAGERQLRAFAEQRRPLIRLHVERRNPPAELWVAPLATPARERRVTSFNDSLLAGRGDDPGRYILVHRGGRHARRGLADEALRVPGGKRYPGPSRFTAARTPTTETCCSPSPNARRPGYWTLFTNPRGERLTDTPSRSRPPDVGHGGLSGPDGRQWTR